MKIDLTPVLKDADGKDFEDGTTMGKALSDHMFAANPSPMVKFYDWAKELRKSGTLEVDRSDYDLILRFVESGNHSMNLLARGQIYDVLKSTK